MADGSTPLAAAPATAPASSGVSARRLASLRVGDAAHVRRLALDAAQAAWLRAVGIGPGERLLVLRRAPFGGPLHVRTGAGGEFALCSTLARAIEVEPAP